MTTTAVCKAFEGQDVFPTSSAQQRLWFLHQLEPQSAARHMSRELPIEYADAERQQIPMGWNDTATDYPRDICLHQLFEAQVERTPNAVAVSFEGQQLTYQELNAEANQLAHHLRQLGVGPEVLVGLSIERSLEMLVALLGILKAGGAYVPLDPTYPSDRLTFMFQDAQIRVLVTQQYLTTHLPVEATTVVCLDAQAAVLAQQSKTNPVPLATSDNLAYVIYTSGSTGRPKGVEILHRAVVNFLLSMSQQPGLTAEDTLLAVTTLSFDIAALELFLPLIVGAHLIVASREATMSGSALAEILASTHTTVMQATPVTWHLLLTAGWKGNPHLKILCGGEALPLQLARQLLPKVASLWNLYGPTESTIWSTVCKIEPDAEVISIGRPIANTQVYLLDKQLQPVPIGVSGELYIGGDGLARGYLNRPELTAERFIPHLFSDKPGARLYKTGDLARYQTDGSIELIGRLDHQVKIRGFRIEPGEIEAVLSRHPPVEQAVVLAREDVPGDKRLVAYVVASRAFSTMPLQAEIADKLIPQLRQILTEHLPDYMMPSAFVLLERFPLTPNGKVDRRALPAPPPCRRIAEEPYIAPTLKEQYQLVAIWEELLDARPIGIRDNFFYLGGHSLLAARLIERIEQVFGKKIHLSTLFAGPTIEDLANALQQQTDIGSGFPMVAVQTGGPKRPFFFLHGDFNGGPFYCFPLARDLGADQPFHTLEPYRFDELGIPPTFEAVTAAHIKFMRTIQPEGPYLVGGYCNGGLVAYEIARQLYAEGQTVDLLVLMNPMPLSTMKGRRSVINRLGRVMQLSESKQLYWFLWLQHMYRYLQHGYRYLRFPHYRKWTTELASQGVNPNGGGILTLKARHEKKLERDAEHLETDEQIKLGDRDRRVGFTLPKLDAIFPEPIFPTAEALQQDYEGMFSWVASDYVPGLYPGKSTFFFTRDSEERGEGAEWLKVAAAKDKEVEVHHIAGTHSTCKTKHLHDLTEHLRICLNQVQASEFMGPI